MATWSAAALNGSGPLIQLPVICGCVRLRFGFRGGRRNLPLKRTNSFPFRDNFLFPRSRPGGGETGIPSERELKPKPGDWRHSTTTQGVWKSVASARGPAPLKSGASIESPRLLDSEGHTSIIPEVTNLMQFLTVHKALADASRARAMGLLTQGELCLCELIQVLGLAPSTVSKHLTELYRAGLVKRRKEGRWHFYRLPGRGAPGSVREAVRSVRRMVQLDARLQADLEALREVKKMKPEQVSACYSGGVDRSKRGG